jgi:hypothetical protein
MAAILSPPSIYGDNRKTKLPLLHNTRIHALEGHFGNSLRSTIRRMPDNRASLSLDTNLATRRMSSSSKLVGVPESRLRLSSLRS